MSNDTPRSASDSASRKAGQRSTEEVLDNHLWQRNHGTLDEDLTLNYSPDVVLLTGTGMYQGHKGVRHTDRELFELMGRTEWKYKNKLVSGEIGFLEWIAESSDGDVRDGADSFLIREGKIVAQTIHYSVLR